MVPPLLGELLALLAASVVVVALCQQIRIPSVVGFLISGALIGPGVLGLVEDQHSIEVLAEIGVVLLLFEIGLEFSLREFARMRTMVLGVGGTQVLVTIGAITGIGVLAGASLEESVFAGFLAALSSTALVLTLLAQRGDAASVHGRVSLGVLIFQDLAIVPLMLLTPLIAGTGATLLDAARQLGLAALVVVATLVGASWLFPRVLHLVARTRNRELFTIVTVLAALGTAYLTGIAGLSLALGAFLAGLVISESRYGSQVLSDVLPFKDVFNSLFFISVGMLVDPGVWTESPLLVFGGVAAVLVLKGLITGGVVLAFGFGARVAVLAGLSLAQVGEFSFVLAHLGLANDLLSSNTYRVLLSVIVVSMVATPAMMALAAPLAERVGRIEWLDRLLRDAGAPTPSTEELHDHVVICGYGLNGGNVARVLERLQVSYIVVELNPQIVADAGAQGSHIFYGDATRRPILEHAKVERARAIVVTVEDRAAARRICAQARALNREAFILVRTRYVADAPELRGLGADEVVPEEFETSLELVGRLMATYGASESSILLEKTLIRREGYGLLIGQPPPTDLPTLRQLLTKADVVSLEVGAGSRADGATVQELALPRQWGVNILAIERGEESFVNPSPDLALRGGDRLLSFGRDEDVERARELFEARPS